MVGFVTLTAPRTDELVQALVGAGRLSDLATLKALKEVGGTAKTEIVRTVAKEAGVAQKHVRPMVKVYGGSLKRMRVRVWHGLGKRLREAEVGPKVLDHAPPGAVPFYARMKSGHRGYFYRSRKGSSAPRRRRARGSGFRWGEPDLPITEITINLEPIFEDHAERIAFAHFDRDFQRKYRRDLEFRLRRKGWKRNTR